jgi:hypothetical protein
MELKTIASSQPTGSSLSLPSPDLTISSPSCQSQEKRLNILIRTTEGEYGDLLITVVSHGEPKAAKVIKYPMKPLSLQSRVSSFTEQESSRPRNRIRFSGNVGIQIFHEWVLALLPDIPSRIDENSTGERYPHPLPFSLPPSPSLSLLYSLWSC